MSSVPFPDAPPGSAPYQLRGGAVQFMRSRHPETIISGPAGSGKSRSAGELLFRAVVAYPGCRLLIVRKTRVSLTETFLVTWEDHVVPSEYASALEGAGRANRQSYFFDVEDKTTGEVKTSEVMVAGLDKPSRILSSEYDLIFVQQAEELTEDEWEILTTRLRNGVMPYQRLLGDANPDAPSHWIKRRSSGPNPKLELIESRHEDNPLLYDTRTRDWTDFGRTYIARLDSLTGVMLARLRHGRWEQAEGAVYPGFRKDIHVVNPFDPPAEWERYVGIDFGWQNPFTAAWAAVDPDGRAYIYRTYSQPQRLVSEHSVVLKQLSAEDPRPVAVICDHDAEGRADLQKNTGWGTIPARKSVREGIQCVSDYLAVQGDGRPRLYVMRDRHHGDGPSLIEEFELYAWKKPRPSAGERPADEEPAKVNDHLLDPLRYICMHLARGSSGWTPKPDDFQLSTADFNLEEALRGSGSGKLFGGR